MTTHKLTDFKSEAQIAKIKKDGDEIIKSGKIMDHMLKTAGIFHYGNKNILQLGILSGIQHAIKDYYRGIYINITGSAGKGKTDALEVLSGLMPDKWVCKTSISPKVLYYAGDDEKAAINKANIIFSDDIELESIELVETLKKMCSKYSERTGHFTLVEKKPREMFIRAKYSFWFTSVASLGRDQLSSRFINVGINESPDRDQMVANLIGKNIANRTSPMDQFHQVSVCKYIFENICAENYGILIPYQSIIRFNNPSDSRLIASFYSILQCITYLNRFNREIKQESVISEVDDFAQTISVLVPLYKTNKSKLSNSELKILKIIENAKEPITQAEIQKIAKKSAGTISKNISNLLEMVSNLSVEQKAYGVKHYFMTSISEIDMNEYMPDDKLSDIYLDLSKYDDAIDGFWRSRGE